MLKKCFLIAIPLFFFFQSISAQPGEGLGWTQFRGALRDGSGHGAELLKKWPENGPALLWTREIGSGFSEIIVCGDHFYTMYAEKTDSVTGWEYIASFDASTGEELWRTRIDSIFIDVDGWGDGPRSTPAVDDKAVYGFSGHGKLHAVSKTDGSLIWTVDFVSLFNSTLPRWGFSSSPVLHDRYVVMEAGGDENRAFVALDKTDGSLVWAKGQGDAMYTSPIVIEAGGKTQLIFVNGRMLSSYSETGDTLWTYRMPVGNPMASPLFIPPSRLFVSANNGSGSFLIEVGEDGPTEVFTSSAMKNDWSSSVYKDGYIYGFNLASLQCISAEDGKRIWHRRGFGKGSLILVGDKLLVLSDLGVLSLVEASPDGFTELGSVSAIPDRSWTAPSYANGRVFVRNHTHMACFDLLTGKDVVIEGKENEQTDI